ncbi:MAG: hypothetical protein ACFFD1_14295, partial [Candidatus Thorarchaeota archaeon]
NWDSYGAPRISDKAIEKGKEEGLESVAEMMIDPVFGVYHESEEFLIDGFRDLLVDLGSSNQQRAYFKIDKEFASKQLDKFPNGEIYRAMAKEFLKYN